MASKKKPTREQLEEAARQIGYMIGNSLPKDVGFGLIVFDFGGGGNLAWITNGKKEDMAKALREAAQTIEDKLEFSKMKGKGRA